ncbi:MAG: tyrosine-protein phosphatase [Chloroflexota bacterium]
MIDLHTHLLPGVDDGARSLEEALALCAHAAADGTTVAVATPHGGGDALGGASRPTLAEVTGWTATLQSEVDQAGISLRLVPGMEIAYEVDLLGGGEAPVTLGGSPYLLLELPASLFPTGTPELVFRLQAAGYVPVIAHPERNLGIMERPEALYDLVTRGCLAQLTAMSLTGAFGPAVRATAEALLAAGLVQVIASDAHWFPERPTGLSAAVGQAARIVGRRQAMAMVTSAPQAILAGQPVTGVKPVAPKRQRQWKFW